MSWKFVEVGAYPQPQTPFAKGKGDEGLRFSGYFAFVP